MQRISLTFNKYGWHGVKRSLESMSILFDADGQIRTFKCRAYDIDSYRYRDFDSIRYPNSPNDFLNISCKQYNLQICTDKNLNVTTIIDADKYTKYEYYDNGYLKSIETFSISKELGVTGSNKVEYEYDDYCTKAVEKEGIRNPDTNEIEYKIKDKNTYEHNEHFRLTNRSRQSNYYYPPYVSFYPRFLFDTGVEYFNPCIGSIIKFEAPINFDEKARFIGCTRDRSLYKTNFTTDKDKLGKVSISVQYKDKFKCFTADYCTEYYGEYHFRFVKSNDNSYKCIIYEKNANNDNVYIREIEHFSKNYLGVYNFDSVNPIVFMNNLTYILDIFVDIILVANSCNVSRASIIGDIITPVSVFKPSSEGVTKYLDSSEEVIRKGLEEEKEEIRIREEQEKIAEEKFRLEREEKRRKREVINKKARERIKIKKEKIKSDRLEEIEKKYKERKRRKEDRIYDLAKTMVGKESDIDSTIINRCKRIIEFNNAIFDLVDWRANDLIPINYDSDDDTIVNTIKVFCKTDLQLEIINAYGEDRKLSILIELNKLGKLCEKAKTVYQEIIQRELFKQMANKDLTSYEECRHYFKKNFGTWDYNVKVAYNKYMDHVDMLRRIDSIKFSESKQKPKDDTTKVIRKRYLPVSVPDCHWELTGRLIGGSAPGDFTSLLDNELFENDPEWNLDLPYKEINADSFYEKEVSLNDITRRSMYVSIMEDFERSIRSKTERGDFKYV